MYNFIDGRIHFSAARLKSLDNLVFIKTEQQNLPFFYYTLLCFDALHTNETKYETDK